MKKLLITMLCISGIAAALPAFAGTDAQLNQEAQQFNTIQLAQADATQSGMNEKLGESMAPEMHKKMPQMMKDCMKENVQSNVTNTSADLMTQRRNLYAGH
ncbi:hypothetical protein [Glaciimonas immobilis]|uniref:Uncharacterized protein n=1 Tax=Glaciimonas immobilis TaxID=728004 RepID=A0A840RXZ0_9BURK|nr:hypothetical protein [Glaciimonas immobilis]KAF3996124.1 hypothetical protein HAV38_20495 [Glaciimonas immobilis]MBB5201726.1 hypothetical protein [Glaciimonas immobilis]